MQCVYYVCSVICVDVFASRWWRQEISEFLLILQHFILKGYVSRIILSQWLNASPNQVSTQSVMCWCVILLQYISLQMELHLHLTVNLLTMQQKSLLYLLLLILALLTIAKTISEFVTYLNKRNMFNSLYSYSISQVSCAFQGQGCN